MKFNKTLLSMTLFSTLSTSTVMAFEADKTYHFTILHVNDTHGHFWKNDQSEYGFSAQKTAIDNVRQEVESQGGSVILLHAGDYNTGVPESDMQNAKPDLEGMNMLGFEALTLGNHEFDSPLQVLEMQEKWAKFPFLSANVINNKTNKPLVRPYTILNKQGLKIAVVGLTTEDTAKLGNPEVTNLVTFKNPIQTAKETLEQLNKTEKPDVRIALTHMGYYYNAQHGSNAPGDVSLARTLDKGAFDVIIGGHTHDLVCLNEKGELNLSYKPNDECKPDFQNGTWIAQAGEWGKFLGRADFEFKNGKTQLVKYQLIPINLKHKVKLDDGKSEYKLYQPEIAENQQVYNHLKTYQDSGSRLLNVKVGEIKGHFEGDRKIIRFEQTNLGRLIAQSQMERVKADLAVMNSGGIRTSLDEGEATYKDLLTVQPFGNMIATVDLTGQELLDYLRVVGLKEVDTGGYPQFAGLSMVVDRSAKTISEVKIGGKPLDLTKTYRLSVPDYCAGGGDGYPVLKKHPTYVNTGFIDAEMLKKYFGEKKVLNAADYDPKNDIIFK